MRTPSERILVTGAAGFIGSHLVERLLSRGASVIGVDNFDPFYSPEEKQSNLAAAASHPCFRLVHADCADLPELEAGVGSEPIDAIIHLAAKAGVRPSLADPLGYLRANVIATQSVLELARRREIDRIVFGSSSSVYGNNAKVPFSEEDRVDDPISPYAASKRAAELLCATHHHLYGTGILALRFFTVYGPRQRPDLAIRKFATLMLQRRPLPLYGDGGTERDYTWIDDILDGVLAALARTRHVPGEYEVINLGGHRTTSLTRLVELLAKALAVEPVIERLPPQPGDVDRTWAEVTKARILLGYVPRTPIEDGIPRFAKWMKERTPPERRERPRSSVPTDQNR